LEAEKALTALKDAYSILEDAFNSGTFLTQDLTSAEESIMKAFFEVLQGEGKYETRTFKDSNALL